MACLLLLIIPAGLAAPFALVGHGFRTLGRAGLRPADRRDWLRGVAPLLGAVAVAFYTWGMLLVALAVLDAEDGGAGSAPLRPCRTPGQSQRALSVVDYTVDYVPLRFVCETQGGGTYSAETVPDYVNAAVVGFALAAVVCAGAAALGPETPPEKDPAV
ncbi:hypothetical protein [Streptomyces sp. NPDC047079]|uniref:hypothetical protein n=1 Tax=Streptomyces sp. NPDC047079 TaxID=3154607 RepID=UPI003408D04E